MNCLPPPKKSSPPAQWLRPGKFVRIVHGPNGYQIVTVRCGAAVGGRLDKGKGIYPAVKATGLKTTAEAIEAFEIWEQFCSLQVDNNKKKKHEVNTGK